MHTDVTDQLRAEARAFRFRFGCEQCVYFEPSSRRCSEGYPNHEHLDRDLEREAMLVFCKSFELL